MSTRGGSWTVACMILASGCPSTRQEDRGQRSGAVTNGPIDGGAPLVETQAPPWPVAQPSSVGTATAEGSSSPVALTGMVLVPGGTFEMGERGYVEPVTTVTLAPYYLDRTEVSVAMYAACVSQGRCTTEGLGSCGDQSNWARVGRGEHPMNCVDWDQARTLCAVRGNRLPTEAEWELGARGTDGRPYPWGYEPPSEERARYNLEAQGPLSSDGVRMTPKAFTAQASQDPGTSPVDSHPSGASPFGALNMAGTVWEWIEDAFGPYGGGAVLSPTGPQGQGPERVVRGGGYSSVNAAGLRTFDRESAPRTRRGRNLGFRCARSVEPGN
jgi:formylglycine-generating enzyme required for sulfatase activity